VTEFADTGLTLEQPEAIVIPVIVPSSRRRMARYNSKLSVYQLDTQGWTVVGTNRLFGVYQLPLKAVHWGLAHIPTGYVLFGKFRLREEAEDFGSWVWLNSVNREGLTLATQTELVAALGPRVRSRASSDKVLIGRPVRTRNIGCGTETTTTEKLMLERAAEMYAARAELKEEQTKFLLALNTKEQLAERTLTRLEAMSKAASENLTASESMRRSVEADRAEFVIDQQDLRIDEQRLIRTRDSLARAVRGCVDPDEDVGVLRALRGIRSRVPLTSEFLI